MEMQIRGVVRQFKDSCAASEAGCCRLLLKLYRLAEGSMSASPCWHQSRFDDRAKRSVYARSGSAEANPRVSTVMSSSWPNCCAALAIACADCLLISRVRSKPKMPPVSLRASSRPRSNSARRTTSRCSLLGSPPPIPSLHKRFFLLCHRISTDANREITGQKGEPSDRGWQ